MTSKEAKNLLIRPGTTDDVALLQQIGKESYYATFASMNTKEDMDAYLQDAFNENTIRSELKEPNSVYWIAFIGESPAGYARLRISAEVENYLGKNAIELHRLYAMPDFMGKGIGKALMQTCFNYAYQNRFEWMWLGVWEKNFKAQAFYQKWGFEKFSEHTFLMGSDPQIDWLLRKKLLSEV